MINKLNKTLLIYLIFSGIIYSAPIARIMKAQGDVLIKRMGKNAFTIPGKAGLAINNGDAIKVGEEGFAVAIFIDDKSVVKIREKTQLNLLNLQALERWMLNKAPYLMILKRKGEQKHFE